MIEIIKDKLWNFLQNKEISLVIIFDGTGEIVWNKGRRIKGRNVLSGEGFAQSYILECLRNTKEVNEENVLTVKSNGKLSISAIKLFLKNVIVLPLENGYFLYLDSGNKKGFSEADQYFIKTMGSMLKETISSVKKDNAGFDGNCSKKMEEVRNLVLKYSFHKEPVLFLGETGVGKTFIAEFIHKYSGRKGKFVNADITTLNENLFESTFFGHKKGAFTDARENKKGLVEEAEGGTLFIDEISEIPISFQSKLLRFIDKQSYRVLGENEEKIADVRIVAATNKDLNVLISEKLFKEDLYYRVNTFEVTIPPLRERRDDIRYFIEDNMSLLGEKIVTEDFFTEVLNYDWPGNFRELKTVLKRAGVLLDAPITGTKIKEILNNMNVIASNKTEKTKIDNIWDDLRSGSNFWDIVKEPYLDRELNRDEVRNILDKGLQETNGSYKDIIALFNLKPKEYKKFLNFLSRNKIKV